MPVANPPKLDDQILIRGADMLAADSNFKLVGREDDLKRFSGILMRNKANSVILLGAGGVGCTALCKGLQTSKDDPDAPFDIITKKLFWLNTDTLFKSGDAGTINKEFDKVISQMRRLDDAVLILEDAKNFIDAARSSGCSHLINSLINEIRNNRIQAILEARHDDYPLVLKSHADISQFFTVFDLQEPSAAELPHIVDSLSANLESHHNIKISDEARKVAIELTSKYRVDDLGLSRAQPERSITLIDRAMTAYRQIAHANHPDVPLLESKLTKVKAALSGKEVVKELQGRSVEELQSFEAMFQEQIEEKSQSWKAQRAEIRQIYKDQRDGEELIRTLESEIDDIKEREKEAKSKGVPADAPPVVSGDFAAALGAGYDSADVAAIRAQIKIVNAEVSKNRAKYETLTAEIDGKLLLTPAHIYAEFSAISGIPADKLNEDEKAKVLALEANLNQRVFNQPEAIKAIAGAVKVSRGGLQDPTKPQGAFMFPGPSGSGKTEVVKQLADLLGISMVRFDMSEYMEKHAVAKLIGAPPGYDGFEAGGILTNAIRKNPVRILLFDEVEKGHPDFFDILLQVLDDARLTDNRGLTSYFDQTIIVLTTNIGSEHFLNTDLTRDQAMELATHDLEGRFRPEFLNRFAGRRNIIGFNMLDLGSIEKIAKREFGKINTMLQNGNSKLSVAISEEELNAMCKATYDPKEGARGITGFIGADIKPEVAETVLRTPDVGGNMQVHFDPKTGLLRVEPPQLIIPQASPGVLPSPANI